MALERWNPFLMDAAMYLIVGLNPAIDVIMRVSRPVLGELNRAQETAIYPAGKATNLAHNLSQRNLNCILLGYIGRPDMPRFINWLEVTGANSYLIPLEGSTRINLKVIDNETGGDTEFNSKGIPVFDNDLAEIETELKRLLKGADALILTGSLPPGAPEDIYARWIHLAKQAGVISILDASGAPLNHGVRAIPWMVKLNWFELSGWAGTDTLDITDAIDALTGMITAGTEITLATRSDLVLMVTSRGIWKATPPGISARNPIGAGDALLAGLVYGRHHGTPLPEMLRQATAGAVASITSMEPGGWNQQVYEETLPLVAVEAL